MVLFKFVFLCYVEIVGVVCLLTVFCCLWFNVGCLLFCLRVCFFGFVHTRLTCLILVVIDLFTIACLL